MRAEASFRAMGSTAHVVIIGGSNALMDIARLRIDDLERRWSRFLPDSEVSRINAAAGRIQTVSDVTWLLVDRLVSAWRDTKGLFDPTVHDALCSAGYRYSSLLGDEHAAAGDLASSQAERPRSVYVPGCNGILLDASCRSISLGTGTRIDPGGMGKGLGADLVVSELLSLGARGAMVNLGGDLRAEGDAGVDAGWVVSIDDPISNEEAFRVAMKGGAIATSSQMRRRWSVPGGQHHHLIDPATGLPSNSDLAGVSVMASEAWWAEALSKAAFLGGSIEGVKLIEQAGATAVMTSLDGSHRMVGAVEGFLV